MTVNSSFRRIRWFADWLNERNANREVRELRQSFAPRVAEAEKAKDWNKRNELLSDWQFESQTVLDPIYARKAEKLTAIARKYGITVPSKPVQYDGTSVDWSLSNATGDWLLTTSADERLRREIKVERRVSYDEGRKWATLAFALVGSVLAFMSVLSKQRQPDPCQHNYYRADSGECTFALQKNVAQSQALPSPSIVPHDPVTAPKPLTAPSPKSHRTKIAPKQ